MDHKVLDNVVLVPLKNIKASASNPRVEETREQLADLIASITQKGLIQPVVLRSTDEDGMYEIVAGYRRITALRYMDENDVPAIIVNIQDDEVLPYHIIENLHRAELHPMLEARAFVTLIETYTQQQFADIDTHALLRTVLPIIAAKVGKKQSYVAERLQLINLCKEGQEYFEQNIISLAHALLLAKLTPEKQEKALEFLITNRYSEFAERVAKDIKVFKNWIATEIDMNLSKAPWDKEAGDMIPGVPACMLCPKNSGYNTALFAELNGQHVCTDRLCFNAKLQAYIKQTRKVTKKDEQKDFVLLSTTTILPDDTLYVKGQIKNPDRYKVVSTKKQCEHTMKGQFVNGPKQGEVVDVCTYSKCNKHWPEMKGRYVERTPGSKKFDDPAEVAKREKAQLEEKKKVEFEREFRYDVMTELLGVVPKTVTAEFLRQIVLSVFEGVYHSNTVWQLIAKRRGLSIEKFNDEYEKLINTADIKLLMELFHELQFCDFLDIDEVYDINRTKGDMDKIAKEYKLKLDKIRKGTEKRIAALLPKGEQGNTSPTKKQTTKTKKSTK